MGGARGRRTLVIPRAIRKFKRPGKKTPARLGCPADTGSRGNTDGTDHVSRRGSELLISWNLGRPKFVDQPEIRAGKDSFRGGEFLTQVTNRGVVGRLRQMMQTDRRRLGSEIGNQIDLGVVDLPQ